MQSHGGVFEVESDGLLIFSKRAAGRFPEEGEILKILHGLDSGLSVAEAQEQAGIAARQPPNFAEWLSKFWRRSKTTR